jgi:hypothetical protein
MGMGGQGSKGDGEGGDLVNQDCSSSDFGCESSGVRVTEGERGA